MTLDTWLAFLSIALLATAVPGPAILLVATHNLQYGPVRSLFTISGNISGLLLMSTCSVLGLTALIMLSATAFTILKTAGAAYLCWMGIKIWRNGLQLELDPLPPSAASSNTSLYLQGVLIALTNPKAIVFTSALFPQFINTDQALWGQFALLTGTLMMCSVCCLFTYGQLIRSVKGRVGSRFSPSGVGKAIGATFIGAGLALVASDRAR